MKKWKNLVILLIFAATIVAVSGEGTEFPWEWPWPFL